ncbi:MAG: cytochrome c [Nitrospirae bacterium]|nr:cytochrome c [Candidatus Manganitrophaceae bacterium]
MLAGLLLSAGCGSARRSEPITSPLSVASPSVQRGQALFMEHCSPCHPKGEAGVGPALNNKPLPGFMIKFQVRHGIGAMPAFSQEELSDPDLDQIVAYLKILRHHG